MARPDAITDIMLFLCLESAGCMTKQLVNVDSGFRSWKFVAVREKIPIVSALGYCF